MDIRVKKLPTKLVNIENNPTTSGLPKLPGKTTLTSRSTLARRPALRDVGNKAEPTAPDPKNKKKNIGTRPKTTTNTIKSTATINQNLRTINQKPNVAKPSEIAQRKIISQAVKDSNVVTEPEASSLKRFKVSDIDAKDGKNILLLSEYVKEIYEYLRTLETKFEIKKNHLANHSSTSRMRSVLVNWIVEVHENFSLLQETLHLSVAIIDRYLQKTESVDRSNLQLVGTAALFIACKYEEIYVPKTDDFLYACDNSFSMEQLLQMEKSILRTLNYELGQPLSLLFLRRYNKVANATQTQHHFGKYLLEISLLEYSLCFYKPSLLAASAVYLALTLISPAGFVTSPTHLWNRSLIAYSRFEFKDIQDVVGAMACALVKMESSTYQYIRQKYAASKFNKVSARVYLKSSLMKNLTKLL